MTLKCFIVSASLVLLVSVATPAAAAPEGEVAFTFTAGSGQSVEAFRGGFEVPENRADPDSRAIPIRYVRFPSTAASPGSPIVYLAGGPGGSGIDTAAGNRFPLFMAMREFGDVIALDQRGTGESNSVPACTTTLTRPPEHWADDGEVARLYRAAAEECAAWWEKQGVDLAGYTTVESARDLDDLRAYLGAEKITLWGISYGTHLALASMKEMDDRLDRVVLASAEGLDQTVKLPAYTDAYFERLQQAVNSQPDAAAAYPDIVAMMRGVHARLEAAPLLLDLAAPDGSIVQAPLTRAGMQLVAARLIADPESAAALLALYAALDAEDPEMLAHPLIRRVLQAVYPPPAPITLEGMTLAMDVASGISPRGWRRSKSRGSRRCWGCT